MGPNDKRMKFCSSRENRTTAAALGLKLGVMKFSDDADTPCVAVRMTMKHAMDVILSGDGTRGMTQGEKNDLNMAARA